MKPLVISEMYAFVADNTDGTGEGVIGCMVPESNLMLPLVGADMERVNSLYPVAVRICEFTKTTFKVLKFSTREDITEEVKNGQKSI